MIHNRSCVSLGGTRVDVWTRQDVLQAVGDRLRQPSGPPLLLASANLDHISHFGASGSSRPLVDFDEPSVRWLVLLDGVPLVWRSRRLVLAPVEQLAGSDLLPAVLEVGAEANARVGVFGGEADTHERLREVLADVSPGVMVAECWSPDRAELDDPERCRELAAKVAAADIQLLVVALGKPRQELFLSEYGLATGARVAVAFGAAIDFLSGRVQRAPARVREAGCEWLWRLVQEPRRLAKRYLLEGPPGVLALLLDSRVLWTDLVQAETGAVAALPRPRSESEPWSGIDRRGADRRSRGPLMASGSQAIPQQRHGERRAGADRRARLTTRT